MTGINGHRYRSSASFVIASVDSLLILLGVWVGAYLRLGREMDLFEMEFPVLRLMLIVVVIQTGFYYLDLYDMKLFKEKKLLMVLLIEAIGISLILLAFLYYLVPSFALGRGVFMISLSFIFLFTFFWRLLYYRLLKSRTFRERVLIVGTGALARRIKKELIENGNEGFEIIGFIDENPERIGGNV